MRVREGLGAALWALAPMLAAVGLHRLGRVPWLQVGWSDPAEWLERTPLPDVLLAGLRVLALAGAWWLAISTVAYLLARASGIRPLISATAVLTLPAVRRLADRAVAGSLALSTLATPLVATSLDEPVPATSETQPVDTAYLPLPLTDTPTPLAEDDTADQVPLPEVELPVPDPVATPAVEAEERPEEPTAVDEPEIRIRLDASLEVVVRPGDHLWGLAERRLAEALGRPVADHEVAPYWVEVIEANRERLRSGDPDLIYPGEVIVLPAVSGGS